MFRLSAPSSYANQSSGSLRMFIQVLKNRSHTAVIIANSAWSIANVFIGGLFGVYAVRVASEAHRIGYNNDTPLSTEPGRHGPEHVLRIVDIHVVVDNNKVFEETEAAESRHYYVCWLVFIPLSDRDGSRQVVVAQRKVNPPHICVHTVKKLV